MAANFIDNPSSSCENADNFEPFVLAEGKPPRKPTFDQFSWLAWLKSTNNFYISEIAYYDDRQRGNLTFYYTVRDAEKLTTLSVIQSRHDGRVTLVRVSEAKNFHEQFNAHNMLSSTTTSEVNALFKDNKKVTLGFLQQDIRVLDGYKDPFLNIYKINTCENGLCYYLQSPESQSSPICKISADCSRQCLLLQMDQRFGISSRALLICFAKKIFRKFFDLDMRKLCCSDNSFGSLLPIIVTADRQLTKQSERNLKELQERITIPCYDIRAPRKAIKNLGMTATHYIIEKVGFNFESKSDYYFVRPKLGENPFLILECRMVSTLVAHARDTNSFLDWFDLDNVNAHSLTSQVMAGNAQIGSIVNNDIFDANCKKIMYGDLECKPKFGPSYKMFRPNEKQMIAVMSFDNTTRHLTVTMEPTLEETERKFILAFAIKMIFNTCKLHYDQKPEYFSVEDVVEKLVRPAQAYSAV